MRPEENTGEIYTNSDSIALRKIFGAMCQNAIKLYDASWFRSANFRHLCSSFEANPDAIRLACLRKLEAKLEAKRIEERREQNDAK